MALEKDIEEKVKNWAEKHNFLVVKVRFAVVGYPDRLFISPSGHTIFIEFKRPGEVPEPIQSYRIRTLKARNIPAYWTDNYVGAISILRAALDKDTLDTEELPEKSNPSAVVTSIRRAIPRPGIGEDVHCPGGDKDSTIQSSNTENSDHCPPESDL